MTLIILQPEESLNYKRFGSSISSLNEEGIPEAIQNRKLTDKHYLTASILFILLLIGFLTYTLSYADIDRLKNGHQDNCGNICGQKNVKHPEWECTGKDMTDKPIYKNGTCIEDDSLFSENIFHTSPSGSHLFEELYRKFDTEETKEKKDIILTYIRSAVWRLAFTCLLSLGISVGIVYMFRYATLATIWTVLIMSWLFFAVGTLAIWIFLVKASKIFFVLACIMSIISLALLCFMCWSRDKVRLLAILFKESTKALFDMPKIFLITIMTILIRTLILGTFIVTTLYATTAGRLDGSENNLSYVADDYMHMTIFLNSIITYLALDFIYRIYYMIVGGAVAKWYFTRDKSLLGSPILTSIIVTFKYHLGSAVVGSLVTLPIIVLRIIDTVLRFFAIIRKLRYLVDTCIGYIERLLRLLSKNALIVVAMHGTSFFESGKKAVKLLTLNICNTISVTLFGDFVLGLSKFVAVVISIVLSLICVLLVINIQYVLISIVGAVVFSILFGCTVISTIEIIMDTMFLCFCEDCLINDGVSKPYAMSKYFMQFVENSKKIYSKKIRDERLLTIET